MPPRDRGVGALTESQSESHVDTSPQDPPPETPEASDDFEYSADELVAGAAGFDTTPEAMRGALRLAELDKASRAQAQSALDAYLKREVD